MASLELVTIRAAVASEKLKQPPEMFCKKGVLKNFAKFTGKHQSQNLFFNKVTGVMPKALLKKRLWHRCFPVNFSKFLRAPFLHNTSGRLLLDKCLIVHRDVTKIPANT